MFAKFKDGMKLLILEKILSGPPLVDPDEKFIMIVRIEGGDTRFPVGFQGPHLKDPEVVAFIFGPRLESAFRIHGHVEMTGLLNGQKKRVKAHGESLDRPVQILWPESIKESKLAFDDDDDWLSYSEEDLSKIPSYIEMHMSAFPRFKKLAIDFAVRPEDNVLLRPNISRHRKESKYIWSSPRNCSTSIIEGSERGHYCSTGAFCAKKREDSVTGSDYELSIEGPGPLVEARLERVQWTRIGNEGANVDA
ncbi:hypothetical protein BDZ45DRAFT_799323 [Acephala macrosclerotiorum]|nr:hypothetical protein BDZ45DRAFT_799323 [Acephala macrosclerotiorum]